MASHLGQWKRVRRLGVGGMGEVWHCRRQTGAGPQNAAVKWIKPELASSPDLLEKLAAEAKSANYLAQNSHIVSVIEANANPPFPYIAMELVDGLNLADLWVMHQQAGRRFKPSLVLDILNGTFSGLSYAHTRRLGQEELNIIHRDISPHNVMVSTQGEVKILDFGVARMRLTENTGHAVGKPRYMPPEVYEGRAYKASDVYSAAVVGVELLTDRRYLTDVPPEEIYATVKKGPPAIEVEAERDGLLGGLLGKRNHEADGLKRLVGLLRQCLRPNPNARPSARDVLAQLEDLRRAFGGGKLELAELVIEYQGEQHSHYTTHDGGLPEQVLADLGLPSSGYEAAALPVQPPISGYDTYAPPGAKPSSGYDAHAPGSPGETSVRTSGGPASPKRQVDPTVVEQPMIDRRPPSGYTPHYGAPLGNPSTPANPPSGYEAAGSLTTHRVHEDSLRNAATITGPSHSSVRVAAYGSRRRSVGLWAAGFAVVLLGSATGAYFVTRTVNESKSAELQAQAALVPQAASNASSPEPAPELNEPLMPPADEPKVVAVATEVSPAASSESVPAALPPPPSGDPPATSAPLPAVQAQIEAESVAEPVAPPKKTRSSSRSKPKPQKKEKIKIAVRTDNTKGRVVVRIGRSSKTLGKLDPSAEPVPFGTMSIPTGRAKVTCSSPDGTRVAGVINFRTTKRYLIRATSGGCEVVEKDRV